jgi:hypothetical protein
MKAPDLCSWLGANRSDSQRYREDEQRRQGRKDKLSCFANCEADHSRLFEKECAKRVPRSGQFQQTLIWRAKAP